MERNVMWAPWDEVGLEHFHIVQDAQGVYADGMILRVKDGRPFRAHYQIHCDPAWRVREIELSLPDSSKDAIQLRADGKGNWVDGLDHPIPSLDGCIEVDISITAFTNTLPIRRIHLKPGESSEITAAYIAVPEMEVRPSRQRYTCLDLSLHGGLYKYEDEGLFHGFTAQLPVDADGLVLDYPGLFRRVWSG